MFRIVIAQNEHSVSMTFAAVPQHAEAHFGYAKRESGNALRTGPGEWTRHTMRISCCGFNIGVGDKESWVLME